MSYKKVDIAHLMPGSEGWWHEQSAVNHPERTVAVQPAAANPQVENPQVSTRTGDGGYRQPGIGENELNDFMSQGNGEVVDLTGPKEMSKAQAQKIAEQRAAGVLPEQNRTADRHQRSQVDESKGNPDNVNALQEELGLEEGGADAGATHGMNPVHDKEQTAVTPATPAVSGYDDILAMMRANTLNEGDMARRQHSREIVTGLGDLVSSIANLWATTKGAPNSYDNAKGMTATSQSRYDRELARRKAQNEQILNYYRVKKAAEDEKELRKYRADRLAYLNREAERREKEGQQKAEDKASATEATRAKNPHLAAFDAAFKKTYNERYDEYIADGRSPEDADLLALEDANRAGDDAYVQSVEEARETARREAQDKSNLAQEKGNTERARQQKLASGGSGRSGGSSRRGSKRASSSSTPPSRRSGNRNGNNTRPSKRK